MALAPTISQAEGLRIVTAAYEGSTLHGMLCADTTGNLTVASNLLAWEVEELDAPGYVRASGLVGAGTFNSSSGVYVPPVVTLSFSATTVYYSYSHVVLWLDGSLYPCAVLSEEPVASMLAQQTRSYAISFGASGMSLATVLSPAAAIAFETAAPPQ